MAHQMRCYQLFFFGPYRVKCSCGWKGRKWGWNTFGMAEIEWEQHLR